MAMKKTLASAKLNQCAYGYYSSTMVVTGGEKPSVSGAKRIFAAALLSSTSLFIAGSPAHALSASVCTPGMASAGSTVTCTGTTTSREGFTVNDLTVIADENFNSDTSGTITTFAGGNAGIYISGTGGTIRHSGTIKTGQLPDEGTTHGNHRGLFIIGTTVNSYAENTATGTITVTDKSSSGIFVQTNGGGTAGAVNRGTIITTGATTNAGIAAIAVNSTATATNAAGATITVNGDYSSGIVTTGSTANGSNAGTVSVTGMRTYGLVGSSYSPRTTTLTNSGSIIVAGTDTKGIAGAGPTVIVTNSQTGTVSATGTNARGINVQGSTVTATNDGTITVDGTGAVGILGASFSPATTTIVNTGTVTATGANSIGIAASGPTVFVTNSGTVNGKLAVSGTTNTVTNSGTITGTLTATGKTATIVNEGGTVGDGEFSILATGSTNTVTIRGAGNDINGALVASDEGGMSTLNFEQTDTLVVDDGSGMGIAIKDFDTINFSAGTTRFTGTSVSSSSGIANVTSGATLTTGSAAFSMDVAQLNVSGMGAARGTVAVPAGSTITVTGDVTFNSGGRFQPGIASDTSAGVLTGTNIVFNSGSEVYADVTSGIELTTGNASKVATATTAITDNGLSVYDNSILFSFTHEIRTGNELYLIAKRELRAVTATDNNNGRTPAQNIAGAIDAFIDSAPSNNPIVAYLAQFPVAEQEARLFQLVKDSLPEAAGATGSSAVASADMVLDLIMGRLANGSLASSGSTASGVSAGEQLLGGTGSWAIWGQASASFADYNPAVINGFESDTYAMSGGIDGDVSEGLRLGLSLFYSNTTVDETGAGANSAQDIEGIGALLYGTYRPEAFYVNGTLGLGLNEYESARNSLGGVNRADYDGYQVISSFELGKAFTEGNWELSPHFGARFNYVAIEGFTETGPLPTSIGSQNIASLRGLIGLSGRYTHDLENGSKLIPEGYVRAIREMADPNGAITGSVVGGGTFISQTAARDNLSYALGAGMTYEMDNSLSVRFLYEGEYQEDYQEHSLSAAVRLQF